MSVKIIKCVDCATDFTLSEGERDFFIKKGLQLPKRCKACRIIKKQEGEVRI